MAIEQFSGYHHSANSHQSKENKSGQNYGQFVYYRRLESDAAEFGQPQLANLATRAAIHTEGETLQKRQSSIVDNLSLMGYNEAVKEVNALKNIFPGVNFDANNLSSPTFYRDLIEAINTCIQTKGLFQRNMRRLLYENKEGEQTLPKIDVVSFFGDYFNTAFKNALQNYQTTLLSHLAANPNDIDGLTKEFSNLIQGCLVEALNMMYSSKVFNGVWKSNAAKTANRSWGQSNKIYKDLLNQINTITGAGNPLLRDISNTYHLDTLAANLAALASQNASQIISGQSSLDRLKKKTSGVVTNCLTNGKLAEIIATKLAQINMGQSSAIHTGALNNQKADWMLSFGADISSFVSDQTAGIQKMIDSGEKSVRKQNEIATSEAVQNLMKIPNSAANFIAFVNAKNYTLDSHFDGFSGGSAVSLKNLSSLFQDIPNADLAGVSELITAIMQLAPGAMGDGTDINDILGSMSEQVAYFLFDDFATIGTDLSQASSGDAIHLFYLDGIYVPLSYFLNLISSSIEKVAQLPEGLVTFSIKIDPILYGDLPFEDFAAAKAVGNNLWGKQAKHTLETTQVSMRFLSDFRQLMNGLKF